MAEINDLTIVDASNTARWPENMAPSAVNDAGRADEGLIARWHRDTNGSTASTGSANAYVFAANQTLSAYYDGLTITFDANFANTGAATLNVDAVSADAIVWPDGTALSSGDIPSGAKITVRHDGMNWQLVTVANKPGTAAYVDTGVANGNVPAMDATGYPAADGSQITALTYANITNATGKVLQIVKTQDGALNTGTTVIPSDDTIPQNTEGDEYMTLAITPKSASSRLRIDVVIVLSSSTVDSGAKVALFRDSGADAIAAVEGSRHAAAGVIGTVAFSHDMASPGTSATTFKVRAGFATAGTTTFNGSAGARRFGGVMASSIIITEYIA